MTAHRVRRDRVAVAVDILLVVAVVSIIAFLIRTHDFAGAGMYGIIVFFIAGFRMGVAHAEGAVNPRQRRYLR